MDSNKGTSHKLKQDAFALREVGASYREIQAKLGISSRGTLSYWFKDLVLTKGAQKRLEKNAAKATRVGFTSFNANRKLRIATADDEAYASGKVFVGTLSKRELLLLGAALYWGEGTKSGGVGRTPRLVFTNSDPKMIETFMHFALHGLGVPLDRISGELHLYQSIDADTAKKYWSHITSIPVERFWSTYLQSRASAGKRPTNRLPYGTLAIRIPGRLYMARIRGMMDGLHQSCIDVV